MQDTRHVLQLLRPTKLENEPWYLKQLGAQDPKNIRKGEQLTISTLLVSTQLTKNSTSQRIIHTAFCCDVISV